MRSSRLDDRKGSTGPARVPRRRIPGRSRRFPAARARCERRRLLPEKCRRVQAVTSGHREPIKGRTSNTFFDAIPNTRATSTSGFRESLQTKEGGFPSSFIHHCILEESKWRELSKAIVGGDMQEIAIDRAHHLNFKLSPKAIVSRDWSQIEKGAAKVDLLENRVAIQSRKRRFQTEIWATLKDRSKLCPRETAPFDTVLYPQHCFQPGGIVAVLP